MTNSSLQQPSFVVLECSGGALALSLFRSLVRLEAITVLQVLTPQLACWQKKHQAQLAYTCGSGSASH